MVRDQKPAKSDEEAIDSNSNEKEWINPLTRRGVLALLGSAGLGIAGSQSVAAQNSRPWKQDIDAQCHTLSNLGALTMASNPTAITDFEGKNLSIDNGVLNSANTDSRVWESGEQILLASYKQDLRNPVISRTYSLRRRTTTIIPFGDLSYSNVSQIYLSASGLVSGEDGDTAGIRVYDVSSDTILPDTQVEDTISGNTDLLLTSPKEAYNPGEAAVIGLQAKIPNALFSIAMIHVWAEVA